MEQNVLSISLKEYKKSIDDLKASLLGLDKESKEYEKISEEIVNRQSKLNEVMSVGKKSSDAMDGSLTQMRRTLAEMKKDLADNYKVGSEAWTAQAKLVDELNTKVKKAEEEFGVYSRNVGNYANSVSEAFGQMGVNLGGAQKGFVALTNAHKGLQAVWGVMAKHPYITILTVVLGVLIKLKNAISSNAEAQKKWERAMSAFQPIINLFNRVIGYLVDALASAAEWMARKIPSALETFGKGIEKGIKLVGFFVEGWINFSTFVPRLVLQAFSKIAEGINWVGDKMAGFFDKIGLDKIAKGIKDATSTVVKVADNAVSVIEGIGSKARSSFDSLGASVKNAFSTMAKAQETAYNVSVKQQQLNKDMAEQQLKSAESELKQAELRDKIAKATGEERIKLQKELMNEIEINGKREVALAKRQYEMAQYYASLAPNSKEDNARLRELQANVYKAETAYITSKATVQQKVTKAEQAMTKAEKAEIEKRQKAEEKADKERLAKTQKFINDRNAIIKGKNDETNANLSALEADKQFLEQIGQLSFEKEREFEEKRHKLVVSGLEEQEKELKSMLDNQELSAEQRMAIEQRVSNTNLMIIKEGYVNQKNEEKIFQKERIKIRTDAEREYNAEAKTKKTNLTQRYAEELSELSRLYSENEISYTEYSKRMTKLERDYQNELTQIDLEEQEKRLRASEEYYNAIVGAYGPDTQMALEAHRAFEEAKTAYTEAEAQKRADLIKQEVETQKQISSDNMSKLQSYGDLANGVSKLMGVVSTALENSTKVSDKATAKERENAKKRFEVMKGVQIGIATIEMFTGALGAYQKWNTDAPGVPPWISKVMAVLDFTTALATGAMTISNIKKTKWNGDGGSGSSSTGIMSASATPLLNETLDANSLSEINNTQNANQSDTRVYILESDIQDSNKKVETRDINTSF